MGYISHLPPSGKRLQLSRSGMKAVLSSICHRQQLPKLPRTRHNYHAIVVQQDDEVLGPDYLTGSIYLCYLISTDGYRVGGRNVDNR